MAKTAKRTAAPILPTVMPEREAAPVKVAPVAEAEAVKLEDLVADAVMDARVVLPTPPVVGVEPLVDSPVAPVVAATVPGMRAADALLEPATVVKATWGTVT